MLMLCEGVANDWSAVYLHDVLGADESLAAMGFAAFSLTMAAGRFAGDRVVEGIGPVRFIRLAGLLAATGLGLALLIDQPAIGVVGFGLLGLGLAGVVPVVFSTAGHRDDSGRGDSAAPALATVSTVGYLGFLSGPAVIGGLSEPLTLRGALVVVVALVGLICILAPGVRVDRRSPRRFQQPATNPARASRRLRSS